jgi:hypothetical protein
MQRRSIAMRRLHVTFCATALAATLATPLMATPAVADDQWTVLTMAPDGSWGAATASPVGRAIAFAIANCKIDYQRDIGCGAYLSSIRAGWSLGIRCGREIIVVAEKTLGAAEQAAKRREAVLRLNLPDMSTCRRVVTVDTTGTIIVPRATGRIADQ